MKSVLLVCLLFVNVAYGCGVNKDIVLNDSLTSQLQQQTNQLEKQLLAADITAMVAIFDSACIVSLPQEAILKSKAEVQGYYKRLVKSGKKYHSFTLSPTDYRMEGHLIFEVGTCLERYAMPPMKRLFIENYNYQLVWKKTKSGEYVIQSAIWNKAESPER